jgi:hypothetical protein
MPIITSFEVLAQPLVPGLPNVPYVQQGTFVQISNVGNQDAIVLLEFTATPAFVASSGSVQLFVNYIDDGGNVTQVDTSYFVAPPVGFPKVTIPSGATWIFGVQYVLLAGQSTNLVGSTPQDGLGTRGFVTLSTDGPNTLLVLGTIRQVFNNYDASGNLSDVSEAAYSVPLVGGPLQQF